MANQYSNNTRHIACNECGKQLTNMELSVYPFQWQYSGDMYCIKHETREQFTNQYPTSILSFTQYYATMPPTIWYAIGRTTKYGYTRLTAWYATKKEARTAYASHALTTQETIPQDIGTVYNDDIHRDVNVSRKLV
jgi:hypothetical protein